MASSWQCFIYNGGCFLFFSFIVKWHLLRLGYFIWPYCDINVLVIIDITFFNRSITYSYVIILQLRTLSSFWVSTQQSYSHLVRGRFQYKLFIKFCFLFFLVSTNPQRKFLALISCWMKNSQSWWPWFTNLWMWSCQPYYHHHLIAAVYSQPNAA